jgi:outer membrane protein TolC
MRSHRAKLILAASLIAAISLSAAAGDEQKKDDKKAGDAVLPTPASSQFTLEALLNSPTKPIDLPAALQLAGAFNPEIMLARERVTEAVAERQLAAAQFLPSLNAGMNLNHHLGPVQRTDGSLLDVHRDALYVGLGAGAVGGGTVAIPGIVWLANVSDVIYQALVRRQQVRQQAFASDAVRNQVLLRASAAYLELLRATGRLAVARQVQVEAKEVTRVTADYAKAGQGRQSDADRAATELEQRNSDVVQAESDLLTASAALCQLLSLDPSVRLQAIDGQVVPAPIVPEPIPLPELIAIALVQRPELRERQAAIRAAFLQMQSAKVLPFSPNLLIGYSAGSFGGGSDLATTQSRFGNFGDRQDFDVVLFWTLRNLGVGNVAFVRLDQSRLRQEELRQVIVLDRIRAEVATASARTHSRYAQIELQEKAIAASKKAFQQDLFRTRNNLGLPIELLDSLRLVARSRQAYLDAIIDYNRAQFELYVAMGQPPADILARPVPAQLFAPPVVPSATPPPKK